MHQLPQRGDGYDLVDTDPMSEANTDCDDEVDLASGTGAEFNVQKYAANTRFIKSVLNVTAFSQNIALLVSLLKEDESRLFHIPLLILLSVALVLQVVVAVVIVWYATVPEHDMSPELYKELRKFNRILMMLTTVSLMLNISVNVVFSARGPQSKT